MITEYMLLYFIEKHINGNNLDINSLINTIKQMYTKTEYISIEPAVDVLLTDEVIVQVDNADLTLEYNFN